MTSHHLTPAEIDRFNADGAMAPLPVLTRDESAALLANLERVEAERGGRLSTFANAKPHLLMPFLWDLVHHPAIVGPVTDLLGPDVLCLGTSFINKAADARAHVAWHQDATFWGLNEPRAVTAWLAITPSNPGSGCVRYIPGSHTQAQLSHVDSGDPDNLLGGKERLAGDLDLSTAADLVLEPGEMSLHHVLVAHGSEPNRAGHRRVGFAARYIPADVWQDGGTATLVAGRDHGRMPLEQKPEGEFHEAALARHVDIVRRGSRIILRGKARHLAETGAAAAGDPH